MRVKGNILRIHSLQHTCGPLRANPMFPSPRSPSEHTSQLLKPFWLLQATGHQWTRRTAVSGRQGGHSRVFKSFVEVFCRPGQEILHCSISSFFFFFSCQCSLRCGTCYFLLLMSPLQKFHLHVAFTHPTHIAIVINESLLRHCYYVTKDPYVRLTCHPRKLRKGDVGD